MAKQVAVRKETPMAIVGAPSYLEGYKGKTGAEDIASDEINIPRLKLGQDMSKEVQAGEVERGDLFVNVSGEVLLEAGERLPFVVLKRWREYILWRPQKDDGGILARAHAVETKDGVRYAWDKPNTEYNVKVGGLVPVTWKIGRYVDDLTIEGPTDPEMSEVKMLSVSDWGSEIPGDAESGKAATEHANYVVALPTRDNAVVGLSLSRTALPKAKDFNAVLKQSQYPVVARLFTMETVDDSRDKHDFKNWKFRPNKSAIDGVTSEKFNFVNEETYSFYAKMAASFEDKTVTVDQSDGEGDVERDERA